MRVCIVWFCLFCALSALIVKSEDDSDDLRGGSFSYYKFRGPVSGKIQRIVVPDHRNGQKFDFLAKPDYTYSYGVRDPLTGNSQEHEEARDGDTVQGSYRVLQPDGTTRTVRYTADPLNGFRASVEYHR